MACSRNVKERDWIVTEAQVGKNKLEAAYAVRRNLGFIFSVVRTDEAF